MKPDIDPEEVRRALDIWREINGPLVAIRLAEEYLHLREQPALKVRTCEPVAWLLTESKTFRDRVTLSEAQAARDVITHGGILVPLFRRPPDTTTPAPRKEPAPCDVPDCGGAAITHLCGEHGTLTVEAVEQREQHLLDTIAKLGQEIERLEAEQPAPDVQAQIDAAYLCGAKDQSEALRRADIDAAVARERGRVIGIFVGELQKLHEKTVLDCGDNSCLFATRRGGMRTNGGCRCIERLLDAAVAAEREACAKVADAWVENRFDLPDVMRGTPGGKIRARNAQER